MNSQTQSNLMKTLSVGNLVGVVQTAHNYI